MVQLAELDTERETLDATLDYFVDTKAMPVTLVGAPGESDQRTGGGASEQHRVHCATAGSTPSNSRSKRTAFALSDHDTRVADFYDEDEIRRVYYPEMEALVKGESGARRVVVFDHTLRTADDALRAGSQDPRPGAPRPQRLHRMVGAAAGARSDGRGGRGLARPPLCHRPGVAADPPPGRELAARDRRRAEPVARRHGGDRAPLSRPHRPDLGDHLEPRRIAGTGSRRCGPTRHWCSRCTIR